MDSYRVMFVVLIHDFREGPCNSYRCYKYADLTIPAGHLQDSFPIYLDDAAGQKRIANKGYHLPSQTYVIQVGPRIDVRGGKDLIDRLTNAGWATITPGTEEFALSQLLR